MSLGLRSLDSSWGAVFWQIEHTTVYRIPFTFSEIVGAVGDIDNFELRSVFWPRLHTLTWTAATEGKRGP
jgi:hypothetical protein